MFATTCCAFPITLMLLLLCPQQVVSSLIIPSVLADESEEWFIPVLSVESPGYLNSWAVKVNEGDHVADRIADQYGFVNRGKVASQDCYVCVILLVQITTVYSFLAVVTY